MNMTPNQRAICRELLRLNYDKGFGEMFYLPTIAAKLKISEPLYDDNTETGLLWDLGPKGEALLEVTDDGKWAGVNFEARDMVEAWSRE